MNSKKRFTGPGDLEPVNRITMMRTFACATKALVQNVIAIILKLYRHPKINNKQNRDLGMP